ncbi:MAG: peptide-methionine (R)-S-oxide reductase [Paracoccaceae bacterium]
MVINRSQTARFLIMPIRRLFLTLMALGVVGILFVVNPGVAGASGIHPLIHTPDEWKKLLTPAQFTVHRDKGTEVPFTSGVLVEHCKGVSACDQASLASDSEYGSGASWPSFSQSLERAAGTSSDTGMFAAIAEVPCGNCGGQFGHVFTDGPQPTAQRYYMNGVALQFQPTFA